MRFIHISDLHLGKSFSPTQYGVEFAKLRKAELMKTFARIVDFANNNKVDFTLCAGDFLHSEGLRLEDLRNINSIISRLEKAVMVAVAGNHDPLGEKSPYRKINWTDRLYLCPAGFGKVALSKFNTVVHYYSWDTKEVSAPLLEQTEFVKSGQYNILLFHGDNRPQSKYLPFDANKLEKKGFDYVALGHIHKPGCVGENIFYSGSPEPLDFGEAGKHGFMLCDVLNQWTHFRFVPFAQREYLEFELEAKEDDSEFLLAEKIAATIIREEPENIYTVTLTGCYPPGSPFQCATIEEDLREKQHHCTIVNHTRPAYDLAQLYRENRGNVIGDFISSFGNPLVEESLSPLEQRALHCGVEAFFRLEVAQWQGSSLRSLD